MRICVIGNFSDGACGFKSFSEQTVRALTNAGHDAVAWDGTYSVIYRRREENILRNYFLPDDADAYDVIHVVWHPATLNHYSGCPWPSGPVISLWNGCPQAHCPFTDAATIRWTVLEEQLHDHRWGFYPIPDWIDCSGIAVADRFTVGWSGIRGDGLSDLQAVCAAEGWATNFSAPGVWLSLEDEVRRLARSTVNVCWYGAGNNDRSGAVATCLAAGRPVLINEVPMFWHLRHQPDLYHAAYVPGPDALLHLTRSLQIVREVVAAGREMRPAATRRDFGWPAMVARFEEGWRLAREGGTLYGEQREQRRGY